MKGKDVGRKVKFTTLRNGDFSRATPFLLLEQSAFQLHRRSEGVSRANGGALWFEDRNNLQPSATIELSSITALCGLDSLDS